MGEVTDDEAGREKRFRRGMTGQRRQQQRSSNEANGKAGAKKKHSDKSRTERPTK
jgi:hypothetical protein